MLAESAQVIDRKGDGRNLQALFESQRRAFAAQPYPSLRQRKDNLTRLLRAVAQRSDEYTAAVSADFGNRHPDETVVTELLTFAESARYARRRLRGWMARERRAAGLLMAGNRCEVFQQPLGVVGIMAPWNYPFLMVMRPLVCALAAGNRVLVKPSEITPRTAAFLQSLFETVFPDGEVIAVNGDATVAAAFSALPFDHLLFTGSTAVGRHVMRAAADNLTPVTLELGGKSPSFVATDANLKVAAERIAFGKSVNAGQTCVAPDYVLVPRENEALLVEAIVAAFARMFPDAVHDDHYTSVVNDRSFDRMKALLDDAQAQGAQIITAGGGAPEPGSRKLPLTLVRGVTPAMKLMQDEIFGPILPIVPYDSHDEAVAFILARPHPLCLNLFTSDRRLVDRVVRETHSGALSVNDSLTYVAVDDLPFGGVGESGMGKYMGREGFLTFSHGKTVFRRPTLFNSARLLHAPYGSRMLGLLRALMLR
jgi:coniferyl-aldehyde dehydrogenase